MKRLALLLSFVLLPATALAAAPRLAQLAGEIEHLTTVRQGSDSDRLKRLFDLYWAARMTEMPDYAAYVGYKDAAPRLPDFSREGLALMHRLSHIELAASQTIDRAHLTHTEQLDLDLLQRNLRIEIEGERFGSLDPWRNDWLLVDAMNDRITGSLGILDVMPAKNVADYEAILALLRTFPRTVDEGIARLDEGLKRGMTPPRVTLRHVPEHVLALLANDPLKSPLFEAFQHMPDTIPAAEQQRLHAEAADVYTHQLAPALHKFHDYVTTTYIPHARETIAATDLPDGKAYYAYLLHYATTTDLTPDQIYELGLAEVKRIRGEMDALIAKSGFKGDFHAFCDWLRTDPRFFYTDADAMVTGYRDITKRIDPELPRLFGRLPRLPYGVKAMTGAMAKTAPSAFYDNGSLAAGRPGWLLVNTYDLKSRPKWGMESLALHESVPGHHLQYALVEELGTLPDWRKWDIYPVFSEGWAFYAESLGDELGLYKDPYSKFGELNNDMWRAVRLVVDAGLHAKGWTRQQAIDYCRLNSAKTPLEIENEIDRYIVQPGSATCYKIGALKIRELRDYAEKELGPKFDVRAFHDEILGHGQLPLDLLEKNVKTWIRSQM